MKKKTIPFLIILTIVISIIYTTILINRNKNMDKNNNENIEIENTEIEIEETIEEPKYKDENQVPISLYIEQGNELVKISEYSCDWSPENVLNLFYAIPSTEESISAYNFDSMWKEKIAAYPNGDKCRIGYQVSFKYEDGETYTYNLKCPDDTYFTFPKVMTYLYDDVNLVPGKPYYHITQDVMYDYTIASSIKLVGDVDSDKIEGPITLTAFCFDSEDDFDEEGNYRGNSKYTITITQE
ncbi:MAG: hypothetical protein IKD74_03505 [Clostridia bacterium]|nr:hypothetical protein [Clostridia bacterium]